MKTREMAEEKKEIEGWRKERRDKGRARIQERDVILLKWIAEQYAVRLDHIQVLGGRLSTKKAGQEPLAVLSAFHLVERWKKAGWVEGQTIIAGQPMWVWPSKAGLDFARVAYPYYTPSVSRLEHMQAVNNVRLWVENEIRDGIHLPYQPIGWVSEREINWERKLRGKKHCVDAELIWNGGAFGIEVELRLKSKPRYEAILNELKKEYQDVWYFAPSFLVQDLQRIISKADPHQETFTIYRLDDRFNIVDKIG